MRTLALRLAKRLPVLVPLFTGITLCFLQATQAGNALAAFPWLVFAMALIVLAAIVCSFPLAEFFGSPFARIYFPHVEEKPPPAYRLAEWHLEHRQFDEALHEYGKILRHHPRELTARCLHLELLLAHDADPEGARKSYRRGMRLLRSAEDRAALREAYATARERVAGDC